MSGADRATRVTVAAENALAALGDGLDAADRRDLARLLSAVGAAWTTAELRPTSMGEKLCWSAVCAIASQIAERWQNERAFDEKVDSALPRGETPEALGPLGIVLSLNRDRIRGGT